ncbi:MAG: hypothetical protein OXL68_03465 [Paracoccaceae bacterium]|nr:hypothetical protein [Paracoccaceae bacterium]
MNPQPSGFRSIPTGCGDLLLTVAAFAIAGAGFYVEGVPLAIGAAGLAIVVATTLRRQRFALALGWHAAAFLPIWSGYLTLAPDAAVPVFLLLAWPIVAAALFAALNAGLATAITMMIPWHPGSLALVAGDVWPGTGTTGWLLAILTLAGLDTGTRRLRFATLGIAALLSAGAWSLHEPADSGGFAEIDGKASKSPALTIATRERNLLEALPPAGALFFGENLIDHRDPFAFERWCGYAIGRRAPLFVGVLESDGRSTIHMFRASKDGPGGVCQHRRVHERRVALPMTGDSSWSGWTLGSGGIGDVRVGGRRVHWLICFEAFTPLAWALTSEKRGSVVVVAANDRWTQPIPVAAARRKVARSMARLWAFTPIFAESHGLRVGFREFAGTARPWVRTQAHATSVQGQSRQTELAKIPLLHLEPETPDRPILPAAGDDTRIPGHDLVYGRTGQGLRGAISFRATACPEKNETSRTEGASAVSGLSILAFTRSSFMT